MTIVAPFKEGTVPGLQPQGGLVREQEGLCTLQNQPRENATQGAYSVPPTPHLTMVHRTPPSTPRHPVEPDAGSWTQSTPPHRHLSRRGQRHTTPPPTPLRRKTLGQGGEGREWRGEGRRREGKERGEERGKGGSLDRIAVKHVKATMSLCDITTC